MICEPLPTTSNVGSQFVHGGKLYHEQIVDTCDEKAIMKTGNIKIL